MAILNPNSSDTLKRIALKYLHGEAIDVVRVRLQIECAEFNEGAKQLYKAVPLAVDRQDPYIHAILISLGIHPKTQSGEYERLLEKSKSLYDLLVHLSHGGHQQIADLLTLIEATKPRRNWTPLLLLGSGLTAMVGGIIYYKRQYVEAVFEWFKRTLPFVINWFSKTFSVLKSLPLLGILFNSLSLVWSWYLTLSSGTISLTQKISSLFFTSLTLGLKISAYLFSYLAGGIMGYPAATLFVLSASIDLFKSLFELGTNIYALAKLPALQEEDEGNWVKQAEFIRKKNFHQRSLQGAWVSLVAAILTTIAVAIWCFSPPSLAVAVCSVVFITLIALAKNSILTHINEYYAQSLQKSIRSIEAVPSLEVYPSRQSIRYSQQLHDLQKKIQTLEEKEQNLQEPEKKLARRKLTIDNRRREKNEQGTEGVLNNSSLTRFSLFQPNANKAENLVELQGMEDEFPSRRTKSLDLF
ncbi:hypothetical protein [Legionella londiniensis]|uniref:Uncharacterized protein n=1 Tax=Legionella londiniensis TaxID=45068 RepID=A0A0W0VIT8_9GAMM|nr:hypothetical protein [Legionella londiniensis]KTD19734.1 hypothetical protein Llon_1906 [Legionella londiniensis]STX92355.1 Uncharacterised protein [Legionella londiniensis]